MTPLSSAANMRSLHSEVSTRPIPTVCFCALRSPFGHWQRFAFALPLCGTHVSTFLPPVPRRSFAFCAFRGLPPLRYHEGSDSCAAHLRRRSPRLPRHIFLSFRLQPRRLPGHRFTHHASVSSDFRTSPWNRRLVAAPRRIEFVHLRTDSSPPVAPHPASRRRSFSLKLISLWLNLRLRSCGILRHGLSPC